MSMTTLTILQTIGIFAAYTCMSVLIPALILYKRVAKYRTIMRFMIYVTVGNFYMMNLVFLLQLLHISNRITLILFTLIPAGYAFLRQNGISIRTVSRVQYEYVMRLSCGQLGIRTFLRIIGRWFKRKLSVLGRWMKAHVLREVIEWTFFLAAMVCVLWIFGTNKLSAFGYGASDIPVHNYWINAMGQNHIFVAGVYPFGFHCVIYYLHQVFAIDTYVLLRLFNLVQLLYIFAMLFGFIKLICKSKFAPYIGFASYFAVRFWNLGAHSRYLSALPQEFGMLFILPGIYFAIYFFHVRKLELASEPAKRSKKESTWLLCLYAMNFSMTLAVHFYVTMIAGLFCVALAFGYGVRFFRKGYFGRVLIAFFAAIFIAVLPMGIAYATGTPLQGSLNWGMNVLNGTTDYDNDEETNDTEVTDTQTDSDALNAADGTEAVSSTEAISTTEAAEQAGTGAESQGLSLAKLKQMAYKVYDSVKIMVNDYLPQESNENLLYVIMAGMGIVLLMGLLLIRRDSEYTQLLLSVDFYIGLLLILLASGEIGIPELMDGNRSRVFVVYSLPILLALTVDSVLYRLFGWLKRQWVMHTVSFLLLVLGTGLVVKNQLWMEPICQPALESNGAVTTLTNIIHENKDFTWTIVSANDELRMGEDHGYHYELISFLRMMEYSGADGMITIPTQKVYFFVEKVPIDYAGTNEYSGLAVSRRGAMNELPGGSDLNIYIGQNRWIVMSRMYYWAQQFERMFTDEMYVYYEDDEFICYCVEQNPYCLYNFAIDYGFNVKETQE